MAGDQNTLNNKETTAAVIAAVTTALQKQVEMRDELLEELRAIKNQQELTNHMVRQMTESLKSHEEILRGNGKVGLLTRVDRLEVDHSTVDEHEGVLRGTDERVGLVARVKQLEARADGIAKPVWIVITVVLTIVTTGVIELILK